MELRDYTAQRIERVQSLDAARWIGALAATKGRPADAVEFFDSHWPGSPHRELIRQTVKAAVGGAVPSTAAWAGNLMAADLARALLAYSAPYAILPRLGLQRVPFLTALPHETADVGGSGWVGAGGGKIVVKGALDNTSLEPRKIASIFVLADEILRFARPGTDVLLRDVLARSLARFSDSQLIDPLVSAVSTISPASITEGLTPLSSTGDPAFDVKNLILEFVSNGGALERAAFVLSSNNAVGMRLGGNDQFSDLTRSGGTIAGIPAVASNAVGSILVLVDVGRVLVADDGQLGVDASRNASIEMDDAPGSHAGTGTGSTSVSMFQANAVAIKAERYLNWLALEGAVAYTENALYLSAGSPA